MGWGTLCNGASIDQSARGCDPGGAREVITQDRNHDPIAASLQSRTSIIRQRTVGLHQSSVGNVGNIFLNFIFTILQEKIV